MKSLSRREILELVTRSRLQLMTSRDDCAEAADAAQREATGKCRAARADVIDKRAERSERYQRARGSFGRAKRACQPSVEAAKRTAPKGKKREAAKAARSACRSSARAEEAREYGAYYRARKNHEDARATRKATCGAAKGVRRAAFDACIAPALERHSRERRSADVLESERRTAAKMARGGRRPPVSPAERDQEEIDRARADLQAAEEGVQLLFDADPRWFLRQWKGARAERRRISLAEWVMHYAEETPEAVALAKEKAADAWVSEQWAKYLKEAA